MKNILHTSVKTIAAITVLAALALTSVTVVRAFDEPTATPPGNNTLAPINIGSSSQVKTGGVSIGSLLVNGGTLLNGGLTLSTTGPTYGPGVLGYTDLSWGFLYRPARAGTQGAHLFEAFDGTDLMNITNNGNVGIGTTFPGALLQVGSGGLSNRGTFIARGEGTLGSTVGSNIPIATFAGNAASDFKNILYILRDASGTDWTTTRWHDAIAVDNSFLIPGTDSRVWWERDPLNNIQSWGHTNATYMTINTGNVGIGDTTPDGTLKLDVEGQIGATEYCDNAGLNCTLAADIGAGQWTEGTNGISYSLGNVGIGTGADASFGLTIDNRGASTEDGIRVFAPVNNNIFLGYSGGTLTHNLYTSGDGGYLYMYAGGSATNQIGNGTSYAENASGYGYFGSDSLNYFRFQSSTDPTFFMRMNGVWQYGFADSTFYPYDDGVKQLGLSNRQWSHIYGVNGTFSGTLSANGGINVDGNSVISGSGAIHTATYPDNTRYGYFEGRRSDGSRGFYLGFGDGGANVFLGLESASNLTVAGGTISNSAVPTSGSHLTNKTYVDGAISTAVAGAGDNLGDGGTTTGTVYSKNASNFGYIGADGTIHLRYDANSIQFSPSTAGGYEYYMTGTSFGPYGTRDLGGSGNRWTNVFATTGDFTGNVALGTASVNGSLQLLAGNSSRGLNFTYGTDRNLFAPRLADNSNWDWANEFGFHRDNSNWYFDGNLAVGSMGTSGSLRLDVQGSVGATEYCDADGANCTTPAAIAAGAAGDDLGDGGTTAGSIYTTAGYIGQDANNYLSFQGGTTLFTRLNGAWEYTMSNTTFEPYFDGGSQLGTSSKRWSNLHATTGTFYNVLNANGGIAVDGYTAIASSNGWHSARYSDNTRYGYFQALRSDGQRGFYLGFGDGANNVDFVLESASNLNVAGGTISNSAVPTSGSHLTNKTYVDGAISTAVAGAGDNLGDGGSTVGVVYSNNASGYGYIGVDGNDYIRFQNNGTTYYQMNGAWEYFMSQSGFGPYVDNQNSLGGSSNRWTNVFSYNADIIGSVNAGFLNVDGNAALMNLTGDDHGYVQFYPDGIGAGRKAWMGFGGPSTDNFAIVNEAGGIDFQLYENGTAYLGGQLTVGGNVIGSTPTLGTHLTTKDYVDTAVASVGGDNLGTGGTTTGTVYSNNASGFGYFGNDSTDHIRFDDNTNALWRINNEWEYVFTSSALYPYVDNGALLGLSTRRWTHIYGISGTYTGTLIASNVRGGTSSGSASWASVSGANIGSDTTIYAYGRICAGNASGSCDSANGVVIAPSGTDTDGNVYISGSGNTYFDGGAVGIGTKTPAYTLDVDGSIRTRNSSIYFGTNNIMRLAGDDASALYFTSNSSNAIQLIFRDAENELYGRIYGDGNGTNFGLLDRDGNWAIRHATDLFTEFRVNDVAQGYIGPTGWVTSRYGIAGTYGSSQVQGIWSIGDAYDIDLGANTFGNQYGLGYSFNTVGGGLSGWGHQIHFFDNGNRNTTISASGAGIATQQLCDVNGVSCSTPAQIASAVSGAGGKWSDGAGAGEIHYSGGNVGIGTSDPTQRLDVRGAIRQVQSTTYDIWIQGGGGAGDDRNLALLGVDEDSGDTLYVNHGGEYAGGTIIGGATQFPNGITSVAGITLTSDWYRINGSNGIYWNTYGGGWHMTDSTWMRVYGGKSIYTPGNMLIGAGSTAIGKITAGPDSANPASGIDSFGLVSSGSFGGGLGLQDGVGNFGMWLDGGGNTNVRFGFGDNLGGLTTRMTLSDTGTLNLPGLAQVGRMWLLPVDGANEGGEMVFEGAGANPDVVMDNFAGNIRLFTLQSGKEFIVEGGAGVRANAFLYSSDLSLKENITALEDGKKILSLGTYEFDWKEDTHVQGDNTDARDIGLIAQEVERLFPELVSQDAYGYKSVDYAKLIVPLLDVTKEQEQRIEALEARLSALEQQ